jgi:actin-like protein 6A
VNDGWVETKALNRSVIGGRYLDAYVLNILKKKCKKPILPLFKISKGVQNEKVVSINVKENLKVHPEYESLINLELGRDAKEFVCRMADVTLNEFDPRFINTPSVPYELPDGQVIDFGVEKFQASELLVDPTPLNLTQPDLANLNLQAPSEILAANYIQKSIPQLMLDSVLRCDTEMQASLLANLVIAGGVSAIEEVPERLKYEVDQVVHANSSYWKVKMISPQASERALCAWLGGSILSSLGSFHEMWISRQEYEEYGASIVDRKCP